MIRSSEKWVIRPVLAGGVSASVMEIHWDCRWELNSSRVREELGWLWTGKGPGRQNPEGGIVLLAGRSLTSSGLCGLGLPGWRLLGMYMIVGYPSISEDSLLCYKNYIFYDNKILEQPVITFCELNLYLNLFLSFKSLFFYSYR